MADTENSKTWITSKSIAIAARIPNDLHSKIEAYGMATYPKGENSYDKTQTLIDLISKGLESDGSVQHNVIQSVNRLDVTQSVIQDVKQELLNTDVIQAVKQDILEDVKQSVMQSVLQGDNDLLGKLETAIADSPIVGAVLERLKKLESGRIDPITDNIPTIPLDSPKNEDIKTEVLNHTDILPSEVEQETVLEEIKDETPLEGSEGDYSPISEVIAESETKAPSSEGLTGKALGDKIGVSDSVISSWKKRIEEGKLTTPSEKNSKQWRAFLEWELKGDRWFPV